MGAKMEVLPNSLLKRRGSSTATWGGGTLGRVGGRRTQRSAITEPRLVGHLHQLLLSQVCNNIKESNLWSAIITSCFSHRFATTSRSPTCGRPSSPAASLTEEEVSSILAISTRPWRSFWTRHGGARGRRRRGKPWVSGEEHQEGGVQSCSPSTWWNQQEKVKVKVKVKWTLPQI